MNTTPVIMDQTSEKNWGMLCHLASLSMLLGIPFGNILGPLLVWLIKRDSSPLIDAHGKESLNFQLSLSLYLLILTAATVSLMVILIGFLLLPALIIAAIIGPVVDIVFAIIGAVKASNGELYRYPCTIRFLK